MTNKPIKVSNFIGKRTDMDRFVEDIDKDMKNVITYLSKTPRFFTQATQPTIETNTFAFWQDSGDSKFYLIVNINSTAKKVELT